MRLEGDIAKLQRENDEAKQEIAELDVVVDGLRWEVRQNTGNKEAEQRAERLENEKRALECEFNEVCSSVCFLFFVRCYRHQHDFDKNIYISSFEWCY